MGNVWETYGKRICKVILVRRHLVRRQTRQDRHLVRRQTPASERTMNYELQTTNYELNIWGMFSGAAFMGKKFVVS